MQRLRGLKCDVFRRLYQLAMVVDEAMDDQDLIALHHTNEFVVRVAAGVSLTTHHLNQCNFHGRTFLLCLLINSGRETRLLYKLQYFIIFVYFKTASRGISHKFYVAVAP